MSAVKNWPARIILGTAMLASGSGGWWWLQSGGRAETTEMENPSGDLTLQQLPPLKPQPIPSDSEETFAPGGSRTASQFGARLPASKAQIRRDGAESFPTRNSLVSFNDREGDSSGLADDSQGPANSDGSSEVSRESASASESENLQPPPPRYAPGQPRVQSRLTDDPSADQSEPPPTSRYSIRSSDSDDTSSEAATSAGANERPSPPQFDRQGSAFGADSEQPEISSRALRNQAPDRQTPDRQAPDRQAPDRRQNLVSQSNGAAGLQENAQENLLPVAPSRQNIPPALRNTGRERTVQEPASTSSRQISPTPGDHKLEGAQRPTVTIEKLAPDEIQVGNPAVFEIIVRNEGKVTAQDVVVYDHVPQGTQLVNATPEFDEVNGELAWHLGPLAPGKEVKITLELMPETEGEIGSVAQVEFRSQASVRTVCTKPQLSVQHTGPQKVLVGDRVTFGITISNPGTGAATGVILQEDVPEGLAHPAGAELEYDVGLLRPGETRNLNLELRAEKPGPVENVIRLRGEGNLTAEHRLQLEVVAPSLEVEIKGPARRYLNRQVALELTVANPGTAAAQNVDMVAHLPKGLDFVSADNKGRYDPRNHAVYWSLTELPSGDSAAVQLIAMPIEPGEQRMRLEGTGDMGIEATREHTVVVEHTTELVFSVNETEDPIEVGSETVYEIQIANNGAKQVTNVRMVAEGSPELEILRGDGPTKVSIQGGIIEAAPIGKLAPRQEVIYRLIARGRKEGDYILRVQLTSDETPSPVTKEEGTRVYADQ